MALIQVIELIIVIYPDTIFWYNNVSNHPFENDLSINHPYPVISQEELRRRSFTVEVWLDGGMSWSDVDGRY